MKKVLLSAFALCMFTATAFAEGSKKEIKDDKSVEKQSSEECDEDGPNYHCLFFVSIWDKNDLYIKGESYDKWTDTEEDCCELADHMVSITQKTLQFGQTAKHNL